MTDKLDLVLERTLDAPRELVWKAWTRPRAYQTLVGAAAVPNAGVRDRAQAGRQVPHADDGTGRVRF